MSAPGFTPGPWRVPEFTFIGGHYIGTGQADICEMADWGHDLEAEQIANAHLIAAAPDLYEALETMPERFEDASNNRCTCNIDENACPHCNAWERVVSVLNRVLARARGEA